MMMMMMMMMYSARTVTRHFGQ